MNDVHHIDRNGELSFGSFALLLLIGLLILRFLRTLTWLTFNVSMLKKVPYFDGKCERIHWDGSHTLREWLELLDLLRVVSKYHYYYLMFPLNMYELITMTILKKHRRTTGIVRKRFRNCFILRLYTRVFKDPLMYRFCIRISRNQDGWWFTIKISDSTAGRGIWDFYRWSYDTKECSASMQEIRRQNRNFDQGYRVKWRKLEHFLRRISQE